MLDLMVLCWCQQPRDRPSASQIVSIASAPEFTHLYDVISLNHPASVIATVTASISQPSGLFCHRMLSSKDFLFYFVS